MALDSNYLPEAPNAKLPQYLQDVLAGAQAPSTAPPSPALTQAQAPLDPFLQQLLGGQEEVEVDPETGLIMGSLKRGAGQTFASLADLVGAEESSQEALQWASKFPKQVQDVQSIRDFSDFGTFAVESAFENMANLLAIGAGTMVGIIAAPAAVPIGLAAGVGGGVVNFALQAGEAKSTVKAEGGDPNLVNVGLPAIVNTAIDSFSIFKIAQKAGVLNKVMKHMDEAAEISGIGSRLAHGMKTGAQAFVMEGSTEALQSYNNLVAAKLATDKSVREAFSLRGQDIDEIVNSFAAGGLGAAVTSGPTAMVFGGGKGKKAQEVLKGAHEADQTADAPSQAAPVQDTEVDTDPLEGQPEQRETPPEEDADTPPVSVPAPSESTVEATAATGTPSTFPTNTGVPVRFDKHEDAWAYFAETVKGTPLEGVDFVRTTQPDGTILVSMDDPVTGREVPVTYTMLQEAGAPVPATALAEEGMSIGTDAPDMDLDVQVAELNDDINQRIAYLEAGETGPAPEVKGRFAGDTFLTEKDQLSQGDTLPEGQPLPQNFWEKKVATPQGDVSTMFSAIVADTPSVHLYGKGLIDSMTFDQMDAVTSLTEEIRSKFFPDSALIIGPVRSFSNVSPKASASMAKVNIEGRSALVMELNPSRIYDIAARNEDFKEGDFEALMLESVAHELGHAVSMMRFREESPQVKAAIYREYQTWLNDVVNMNFEDFIKNRFPSQEAKVYLAMTSSRVAKMPMQDATKAIGWDQRNMKYQLSFEEYIADNMAKFVARDKGIKKALSPETKPFWAKVYAAFKEAYDTIAKFMPMPKFKAWIEKMSLETLREELLNVPLESQKIHDMALKYLPDDIMKLKDSLNYEIEGNVRFFKQAETILDDLSKLDAMKREYRVSTGFTRRIAGTFLTPGQIADRYGIPQAKAYMNRVYDYYQTKMKGISEADAIAKEWMDLPTDQADNFGKFLYAISMESDRLRRRMTGEELAKFKQEFNLQADHVALYERLDASFSEILTRLERSVYKDTARAYTDNAEAFTEQYLTTEDPVERVMIMSSHGVTDVEGFAKALNQVESQFKSLKNRNYYPRMRFGDYTITVKEKAVKKGEGREKTAEFLTFESKKERDAMLAQYLSDHKEEIDAGTMDIIGSKLDDTTRALYGMPQLVVDKIAAGMRAAGDEGLTSKQEQALAEISLDLSPGKRYLRHLQHRKNTPGFSTEAMRTYAAYMSNASNHLARVEHTAEMSAALRDLGQAQRGMAGDVTDLAELHSYYTDHFKYLLNPENDWAKLRSFGFLWYLGANVKSALVNTTQVPMVTYPYLASRYGDKSTVTNLARAMKDVAQHMTRKKPYAEAEQRLMDKLLQEGVIDESMASDLAGISEGTALQRIMPANRAHRVMNNINYYGGYMFSIGEKYNRQATAIATFRMHMKKTQNFESSYTAAKEAIHKSQFEYAKYNRPEFMRGKKSAFFLFYNYTQQFMYMAFAGGGNKADKQTAIRVWGMLLLMSGIQGLPFAEYMLSTLDILGSNAKKFFGMDNPEVNVRQDLRELFDDLDMNPDLLMHGAGRYLGAGPLKLLEMFGAPVPNLDITSSLGMGEPLPGLRVGDLKGKPDEMAGQLLLNGLGPIPNIGLQLWNGMASTDPDQWKNFEKALPIAMKNVSKATRLAMRGAETTRGGAEFLPYDGNNPYEMGEIIAQAAGFTSTRMSQKREMYGEQMQSSMYWSARRSLLLERYAYATKTKDRAARAKAIQSIKDFNKSLSDKKLYPYKISGQSMGRSLKSKMRILRRREMGLPTSNRDRLLYSDIEKLYD